VVVQRWVSELRSRLGDIMSGGLYRDVVVVGKVDTGLLLGRIIRDAEKLTLEARVCWSRNMLAIPPLTITRAARD